MIMMKEGTVKMCRPSMCCHRCGRRFELGQVYYNAGRKNKFCKNCAETVEIDISDDGVDELMAELGWDK
jgi:rRNA maturation endonuclease Nob1